MCRVNVMLMKVVKPVHADGIIVSIVMNVFGLGWAGGGGEGRGIKTTKEVKF